MSASADDPARAAARMSVVATIGYTAFIAGPPLLGFLGDHFTVLRALMAVTVMVALAMLVIPATREPRRAGPRPEPRPAPPVLESLCAQGEHAADRGLPPTTTALGSLTGKDLK